MIEDQIYFIYVLKVAAARNGGTLPAPRVIVALSADIIPNNRDFKSLIRTAAPSFVHM